MRNPFFQSVAEIQAHVRRSRRKLVVMNANTGAGHTGADMSEQEILATLYFRILRYTSPSSGIGLWRAKPRDRFFLSKGHGVGGYYCILTEAGFFSEVEIATYQQFESHLPGHPVRQKTPGIEFNTGGLGHGLPVAAGFALSAKMLKNELRSYVLMGDGELEEGSNWEAAMAASKFKLDNLVAIIDRNTLQLAGRTEEIMPLEPLVDKWRAFNFDVQSVDGNDVGSLINAFEGIDWSCGKPHVIIARTVKGKGVSFMEDNASWHHKVPKGDELARALKELE